MKTDKEKAAELRLQAGANRTFASEIKIARAEALENRIEQIHVRLTPQELVQIRLAAQAERRTLSDYLVVAGVERAGKGKTK